MRAAFVALVFLVTLCVSSAVAQTSATTIRVGVVPGEISGQIFYGVDKGFFAKNGLDVQVSPFTSGGAIAAALAGGSIDVGMVDLTSMIIGHAKGVPFVGLASGLVNSEKGSTFAIVVRGDSPIRTAKDFNGQTIAVNGLNNIAQISAQSWIDSNGGDSKSVKFVEMPLPLKKDAVLQGKVNGSLDTEPFLTYGIDAGLRPFMMGKTGIAPAYLLDFWAALKDWAAKNPAAVTKFVTSMREASDWANKNHALSAPILAKYTKIPEEVVGRMHRGEFADSNDPKLVQPVIDATAKYGWIAKSYPAAELFYTTK
ncbi:MAG TPA: ABC transporter substrate-binding protein [Candidatus Acidoferrales bacterium]|nr:ABC transporter substrate-binding protein [Candidatus Acidoferrales bacterium]